MSWRPDNWPEYLAKALEKDPDVDGYYGNEYLMEAGADAMLEALKAKGKKVSNKDLDVYGRIPSVGIRYLEDAEGVVSGTLVFIPDEE